MARGPTPSDDKYRDEDWLREQYVEKELSLSDIAEKCDVAPKTIGNWRDRFDFDSRDSGGYTDNAKHRDEEWLREHYVELEMSLWDMAKLCEASADTIRRWLGRYDIETRDVGDPNEEKNVYDTGKYRSAREEVIERDGGECVRCGLSRKGHLDEYGTDIHVHHITPVKDGGAKFDPENMETVCSSCHSKEHADDVPPWLEE